MKRGQPRRDWSAVTITAEDECRWCGRAGQTERAHVAGRTYDRKQDNGVRWVNPDSIVGLCRACHTAYDSHRLDLLPCLTLAEQVQAVIDLGGIEAARMRLVPSEYSKLPDRRAA